MPIENEVDRNWANLAPTHRHTLILLEDAFEKPIDIPRRWEEKTMRITYEGRWRDQTFKEVTIIKEWDAEELKSLRRCVVAHLYQSLMGSEAEEEAQAIISKYSMKQKPEPSQQF